MLKGLVYRLNKYVSLFMLSQKSISNIGRLYKYRIEPTANKDESDYKYIRIPRTSVTDEEVYANLKCFNDYICEISDCYAMANTDVIIKNGVVIANRYKYDKSMVAIGDMVIAQKKDECVIQVVGEERLEGTCINLCFNGSKNIWHLMFDMLSKFKAIENNDELAAYSILVNEAVREFSFAQEYMKLLNTHKVIYLEPGKLYKVDKLIDISPSYYFIRGGSQNEDVFFVRTSIVHYFRDKMKDRLVDIGLRKFYIKRGDSRLVNEDEISFGLSKMGFAIVKPEEYQFYEELGLFAYADVIVGSIGAAMTNLIYCKGDVKVICIGPEERVGLVAAYSNICKEIGASLYHVIADIVENNGGGTPDIKFGCELEKICELIE